MIYIGETGRRFEVRQKEHKKDLKQLEGVKYTRARRKESLMEIHQLVLTDHIASKNLMVNWEDVRLPLRYMDYLAGNSYQLIYFGTDETLCQSYECTTRLGLVAQHL